MEITNSCHKYCEVLLLCINLFQWVDGKKNIFQVEIIPATTVHALDRHLDMFLSLTATLQLGQHSSESATTIGTCKNLRDNSTEDNLLKR